MKWQGWSVTAGPFVGRVRHDDMFSSVALVPPPEQPTAAAIQISVGQRVAIWDTASILTITSLCSGSKKSEPTNSSSWFFTFIKWSGGIFFF